MSIDLRKQAEDNLIDLKKKATISLTKRGLGGQVARVAAVFDISGSMTNLYRSGIIQKTAERALALAMNFDDNGAADVFAFGLSNHEIGEIYQANFYQFVEREITSKHKLEMGTQYAGVMKQIADFYYPGALKLTRKGGFLGLGGRTEYEIDASKIKNDPPVYVLFFTDGDNSDKEETRELIRGLSRLGIFFQFVGIGNERFYFLDELDNLDGRYIDNANFLKVQNLDKISDDDLYDSLLIEFPTWLQEAKAKQLF
ncbi:hypothetical protein BBD42_01640 [Paenibacillus sp. BIHB 4019]|uniref:VWFA domain-containing protein n=1 Tax=Paenibacillus sp. BIHB 4019 TaxID=1870819 RepID=A0A1B2DC83_9BACL|nr:VWA domain-containing protein [Paenibacillus sp. BIHB 4019]ANY65324.1 hypothetical protein BBD42_01640 [Paenibacillus sp. BIHB 4019]